MDFTLRTLTDFKSLFHGKVNINLYGFTGCMVFDIQGLMQTRTIKPLRGILGLNLHLFLVRARVNLGEGL